MNTYVIPLLEKRLKMIKYVLADSKWGNEIAQENPVKTYRELELEEKREYQKAISILKTENKNES